MWHKYLPLATFPNLANHSPYKLVFGRKPKLLLDLETDPDVKVSGTYREYFLPIKQKARIFAQTSARFSDEKTSSNK